MKKIMLIALAGLLMTSCAPKVYMQIVDVKSTTVPMDGNNYAYNDGKCKITYNFWDAYGDAGFTIENLTDQLLYINLGESFYTNNGYANDYFRNRTYGKTTPATYRYYGAGRNTVSGFTKATVVPGQTVTASEKEVIIVPPHAVKKITEYTIVNDLLEDCAIKMFPKKNRPEGKSFAEKDSPLQFSNYVTYKVGEEGVPVHVNNTFYVAGFKNYRFKETQEAQKAGCHGQYDVSRNRFAEPTKYFIRYVPTHLNINSADAKAAYRIFVK
ncbi:MAG: hypothetical protein J5671_06030 [Bacteroidaceae bacterium]|nr:hypothetical protein [Bacteroidaceae bacterium]